MRHVMVDLETLDTKPTAAIISIGACAFDPATGEIGKTFYTRIDWASAMGGRTVSADTLKWWLGQDDNSQQEVLKPGMNMIPALSGLRKLFDASTCVWGNGATFDVSILENAYMQYESGTDIPWRYYNVRDVRTICDIASGIIDKADIPFVGVPHHALDDAVHQATYVSAMWQGLRNGR